METQYPGRKQTETAGVTAPCTATETHKSPECFPRPLSCARVTETGVAKTTPGGHKDEWSRAVRNTSLISAEQNGIGIVPVDHTHGQSHALRGVARHHETRPVAFFTSGFPAGAADGGVAGTLPRVLRHRPPNHKPCGSRCCPQESPDPLTHSAHRVWFPDPARPTPLPPDRSPSESNRPSENCRRTSP